MEEQPLKQLLREIIFKMNNVCDEIKEIRGNTISKEEYELLQTQIEILSLHVAKNTNTKKANLIYIPHTTSNFSNQQEISQS